MTWRDNLRAASSEDGFIIANGSGASMIPQNTNWHDNYMNSFTEDGIKIANLKDAVSQVETLPQEADTGSLYYLTTGANPGMYYYDGTQWVAGGGGGVKVLTDADYNYPEDNPNRIALWLLPEGMYSVDNNLYVASPNTEQYRLGTNKSFVNIIESGATTSPAIKFLFVESSSSSSSPNGTELFKVYSTIKSTGNKHDALSFALHNELAEIGLAFLNPGNDSDWPENSPDGIAVFRHSGQFDLRYKTKLYLTDTYAVDNFVGRVEINQFENDNNVGVLGFRACDFNHGIIYVGQTRSDGTNEFLYTVNTTAVSTNSQSNANQNSGSSEDPGEDPGGEPGPGVVEPTVTCPFCGQQTPANSTICQICGEDISGGTMPDPEEPIAPEEPTEEPVEG